MFVENAPAFFVIFLLLSIISFFALLPFGNFMQEFMVDETLDVAFDYMPMTSFIFNNFIFFIAAYILIVGGVAYIQLKTQ